MTLYETNEDKSQTHKALRLASDLQLESWLVEPQPVLHCKWWLEKGVQGEPGSDWWHQKGVQRELGSDWWNRRFVHQEPGSDWWLLRDVRQKPEVDLWHWLGPGSDWSC